MCRRDLHWEALFDSRAPVRFFAYRDPPAMQISLWTSQT